MDKDYLNAILDKFFSFDDEFYFMIIGGNNINFFLDEAEKTIILHSV